MLYVDGSSVGSTSSPYLPTQLNGSIYIGDDVYVGGNAAATFADLAIYGKVLTGPEVSAIASRSAPPHGIYGVLFFNDFDQTKDGYSRQNFTSEPSVSAGSEQTSGTSWWIRSSRQYTYDDAGNPIKRLDANGHTIRYTYDDLNRLTRVQYPKGSDVTFVYDDLSRRTSMTDGTGTTTYQYDDAGRLTSVTSPGSKTVSYEYDMAGRRVKMTDPDSGVTTYSYDLAHRLVSLTDPQSLTTTYTYDNADRLTQAVLGNSTKAVYAYDNADRLTQVENRKSNDTVINRFAADGSKNWFTYTGDGIRYTKRDSAGPVRFVYDGTDVLQEMDQVTGSTSANYLQGFGGRAKQRRSSNDRWYQYDGLGSTRALTNSSQTVTDTYCYEAFGNLLSSSGTTVNPYRYVGGLGYHADEDSDLMLLTLRYYDAEAGRFVTRDPAEDDLNAYAYVGNAPVMFIDPMGLQRMLLFEADLFGGPDIRYPRYMAPEPLPNPRITNPLHASGEWNPISVCLAHCLGMFYGIPALMLPAGGFAYYMGQPTRSTRTKPKGATPGTSPASEFFRYKFPLTRDKTFKGKGKAVWDSKTIKQYLRGKELTRTPSIGGWIGRVTPVVGWALLAVDAGFMLLCMGKCLSNICEP